MTAHEARLTETGAAVEATKATYDQAIEARRVAIIAAYEAGWTLARIAAAADLTKAGASKIIANAGVTLRPRGGSLPRTAT